jgi:hypothetical protein
MLFLLFIIVPVLSQDVYVSTCHDHRDEQACLKRCVCSWCFNSTKKYPCQYWSQENGGCPSNTSYTTRHGSEDCIDCGKGCTIAITVILGILLLVVAGLILFGVVYAVKSSIPHLISLKNRVFGYSSVSDGVELEKLVSQV